MTFRINSLFVLCLWAGACKTVTPSQSQVKHDAGRFQNASDPSQWAELTEKEYLAITAEDSFLPVTHPLTVRLQFWADQIRELMIKSTPQVAKVPRPIVRIANNDRANAYADSKPSRVTVSISRSSAGFFDKGTDILSRNYLRNSSYGEIAFKGTATDAVSATDSNLKKYQSSCTTKPSAKAIVADDNCFTKKEIGKEYLGIVIPQQINYLTYLNGMLQTQTEGEAVGILAHELGHYYMAHSIANSGYDYFYQKETGVNIGKPTKITVTDEDMKKIQSLEAISYFDFPKFAGQKYSTVAVSYAMYNLTGKFVNNKLAADSCLPTVKNCAQVFDEMAAVVKVLDPIMNPRDKSFKIFTPMTDVENKAYANFEAVFLKNASNFPASDIAGMQNYTQGMLAGGIAAYTGDTDKMTMLEFMNAYAPLIDQGVAVHQNTLASVEKTMLDRGIGFYTKEQEADDISVEILYELGFDPSVSVSAYLKILANHKDMDLAGCRKNYETGFKTPVWIGALEDDHHTGCFRVYNAYTEMVNHRTFFDKQKSPTLPTPPGDQAWASLLSAIKPADFTLVK